MQIAVTWVFFDAHWQTVTSHLTEAWRATSPGWCDSYQADPSPAGLQASRRPRRAVAGPVGRPAGRRKLPTVKPSRSLFAPSTGRYGPALETASTSPSGSTPPATRPTSISGCKVPSGVLRIIAPRDRAFATQGHIFILWMTVATVHADRVAIAVHPQPGARHRAAGRGGGRLRPGRRRAGLQAPRRARGAPGRPRLPRHEGAHPAPHRPAHHPAGLGQPRSAHAAHPPEAGARALPSPARASRR